MKLVCLASCKLSFSSFSRTWNSARFFAAPVRPKQQAPMPKPAGAPGAAPQKQMTMVLRQKEFVPVNQDIRGEKFRVIDENGQQLGVMPRAEALARAARVELDLLQISPPTVSPPVCKILNYSKHKYEKEKAEKARAAKNKSSGPVLVELSTRISDHDLGWKLDKTRQWISKENTVKLEITPVRREPRQAQAERITELLNKAIAALEDVAKVIQREESLRTPKPFAIVGRLSEKDLRDRERASTQAPKAGATNAQAGGSTGNAKAT